MTQRPAALVAWTLWLVALVLSALAIVFLALSASTPIPPRFGPRGADAIFAVTAATVGAVIALRRPHNPVGWLFLAAGLGYAVAAFAYEYAVYAVLTHPGSVLGPEAAWVANWIWPPALGALACMVLIFPNGRLLYGRLLSPRSRWRPMVWAAGLGSATAAAGIALSPGPLDEFAVVHNPFGLEDAAPMVELVTVAGMLAFGLALLAAGVSLMLRLHRARGEERQQLKWLAYAAVLAAAAATGSIVSYLLFGTTPWLLAALVVAAFDMIPIAAGIAILRHRLYDIDRLINRTLVYGLLTALLGAAYAATVLLCGQLFGGVGGNPPSWAVAGATLAVAALFQPARRRIQSAVDRRFNRRKYNTAQTIDAFSARLRDEIDLDTLSAELLAVVDQTMQPTAASLWLRPSARPLAGGRGQGG
jgi:hypothetical protein